MTTNRSAPTASVRIQRVRKKREAETRGGERKRKYQLTGNEKLKVFRKKSGKPRISVMTFETR